MMLKRRTFLQTSGMAALGALVLPKQLTNAFVAPRHATGLQLFTLFNLMDKDVKSSLQKVSYIGYKEVESAFSKLGPFYGMKPQEFAMLCRSVGLSWVSHHVLGAPFELPKGTKLPNGPDGKPITIPPMKNLKENMQELIDEVAEGSVPYLVCANIPTNTVDEIKAAVDILNRTGEACKKSGITFAYHNHTEEFTNINGEVPYHIFLTQLSPDIKMELDLCWATKAGIDPVDLFKKHPGRFPLWHVKDLDEAKKDPLPVGQGIVDFKRIFDHASDAGMKHFFVEHDMPADAYASITASYAYINNVLKVPA